jgi:hypothetical protein
LEVVTFCTVCVAYECHFFGSDVEVMNGHGIEKKDFNKKRETENYSEGGKEPSSVML